MENIKRLTNDELNDFLQRAAVQLCPELTQQLLSVGLELAQYREKIENKTLIELPCKVGDTVYMPWVFNGVNSIAYLTVTHIIFDTKKAYIKTDFSTDDGEYWEKYKGGKYNFEDFGKMVFLTKTEAEAKLKELQNEMP